MSDNHDSNAEKLNKATSDDGKVSRARNEQLGLDEEREALRKARESEYEHSGSEKTDDAYGNLHFGDPNNETEILGRSDNLEGDKVAASSMATDDRSGPVVEGNENQTVKESDGLGGDDILGAGPSDENFSTDGTIREPDSTSHAAAFGQGQNADELSGDTQSDRPSRGAGSGGVGEDTSLPHLDVARTSVDAVSNVPDNQEAGSREESTTEKTPEKETAPEENEKPTAESGDSNHAPTDIAFSGTSVSENDAGATVATLSATDVDAGDSASFSLSDDASGLFEVVGNELKLKDGASLDHEAQDSHEVTIQVTDSDGATYSETVTINVADVNEGPTDIAFSGTSVSENDAGATVATLSATDVDAGDSASFSLSDDASGLFEVVGNELKLKDGASLDHEAQDSHEVTIQVTDSDGATYSEMVTINVADVNEGPTDILLSGTSVSENDAGATVATLSATDVDAGDSASFTLTDDASGLFEVVGNELKLKDGASLDHEAQDSHEVTIQVTDSDGATYSETVTINVADVNEAPVDFVLTPTDAPATLSLNQDGGTDDAAISANVEGFPTDAITVEVNFSSTQTDVGNGTPLFSYSADGGSHNEALIWLEGSSGNVVVYLAGQRIDSGIDHASLLDGQEHQVSFTWDQATNDIKVYVDGQEEFSSTVDLRDLKTDGTIALGQEQDSEGGSFDANQVFEGEISEVRVFDHARSGEEIADNADAPLADPSTETGLLTNWVMNDAVDGVVQDLAGNNDLTLQNEADIVGGETYEAPTVLENDAGATVATLTASDVDADDSVSFSLSDDASGLFEVVGNELKLKDGASLDHEAQDSYEVTVMATDEGGLSVQQTVTVNVADVNEAPMDIVLSNDVVAENDAGAVVATLTSSDVDAGDVVGFTLTDDASGLFEVVGNELKLKDGASLNHENQDSHEVTLTATDSNGASYTETVTINVADVNEAPTDIKFFEGSENEYDASLSLNQDGGTNDVAVSSNVEGFPTDAITVEVSFSSTQTDVGSGVPLFSYAANGGSNNEALVWLESSSGDVNIFLAGTKVNTGIDNASLLDGQEHQVSFTWDQATNDIKVYVDGQEEFSSTVDIRDLKADGTIALGQEQDSEGGSFDANQIFEGEISEVRIFDYARSGEEIADNADGPLEDPSSESGLVTNWVMDDAVDGVVQDLAGNNDLTLHHEAEVAGEGVSAPTVQENDGGASVATLKASDPDAGDSASFTLTDDASGLFEVVGNELKLKDGASLDHEAQDSHEVTIQVTDSDGATYSETVTINVADVNEGPTDIAFSGTSVSENDAGATVATLSATDVDAGDSASFTLTDDASGLFEVVGNELKLKDGASLDHEAQDSHEVTIQVTDSDGATYSETVTINVADVNEGPTDIAFSGTSVSENDAGATVATLSATDVDAGDSASFTLTDDASGLFEVVGNELKLKDGASLDHEAQDSHEVTIQVTDSDGATYSETVTINVADVNEGPTDIAFSGTSVSENDAGATVATLSATDVDAGDSASFTLTDDASGLFEVVGNELKLKDGASLDHEAQDSHEVTIQVTDSDGATYSETVTINVADVNEGPIVVDVDLGSTNEDTSLVITEAQLLAQSTDPEGAALSITEVSVDPAFGGLTDNGDGSWTFSPTEDLSAQDIAFDFIASDGTTSEPGTAILDIDAVADTPTITIGAVEQIELGATNTTSSGFEGGDINVAIPDEQFVGSFGDWQTTSDSIEVRQETLEDGSTNQFIELNDDAIDYYNDATNINRTIDTTDGATYTVDFEYAPRPGYDDNVNAIEVVINGKVVDTYSADGTSDSSINWQSGSYEFTGDGSEMTIEFRASGEAQDYGRGMFLDDISVTEEMPVGVASGSDGGPIALPSIDVDSTDADGSEILSTAISDIPEGFVISDGKNSFTATSKEQEVDVSEWGTDQLTITPADGYTGEVNLTVTATSIDGSSQAESSQTITIDVQSNDDVLSGTDGHDIIDGGAGNDKIDGAGGNDFLMGGEGNDLLSGGDGNDVLVGGAGDDNMQGNDGSDIFVYEMGHGSDVVDGGVGGGWTDSIQIEGGITTLGEFGVDWTVELTEGSVVSSDSESVIFSDDADGVITFNDGSTLEFDNLEQII